MAIVPGVLGADDSVKAREVIHDLRNALGLVINYATLVAADLEDRTDLVDDVQEIRNAGRRAAELVAELAVAIGLQQD